VDNAGQNSHRLQGQGLRWARAGWLALAAACLGVTAASWPAFWAYARQVCEGCPVTPAYAATLAAAGLTPATWAAWQLAISVLVTLGWAGMGSAIFARRSDDRRALLISALLIVVTPGIGGLRYEVGYGGPVWSLIDKVTTYLFSLGFMALIMTLPNGRFAPRWTLVPFIYLALLTGPNAFAPNSALDFGHWPIGARTIIFILPMFASLTTVPVYRYLRVFTPIERQQTKWSLVGIMLFIAGALTTAVVSGSACVTDGTSSPSGATRLYCDVAQSLGYSLAPLLIPVFIGVAVLRSRLWDIDVIIRRTLVYSVLTGVLALAYFGSVLVLQPLLAGLTGQGTALANVLSTLAVAALFGPVRQRVQAGIDKRFYRKKYDAARTLAGFGASVRDETDLDRLSGRLVGVVDETLQPVSLGLWLKPAAPRDQRHRP